MQSIESSTLDGQASCSASIARTLTVCANERCVYHKIGCNAHMRSICLYNAVVLLLASSCSGFCSNYTKNILRKCLPMGFLGIRFTRFFFSSLRPAHTCRKECAHFRFRILWTCFSFVHLLYQTNKTT